MAVPRVYSIDGITPVVHPSAFVHPSAVLAWKNDNIGLYQQLAVRSLSTMRETEALTEAEANRRRIDVPGAIPLSELKKKHA